MNLEWEQFWVVFLAGVLATFVMVWLLHYLKTDAVGYGNPDAPPSPRPLPPVPAYQDPISPVAEPACLDPPPHRLLEL